MRNNVLKVVGLILMILVLHNCGGPDMPEPMPKPLPRLSISGVTGMEAVSGSTQLGFEVKLSSVAESAVTVSYTSKDVTATAGLDYIAAMGNLTIPAGALAGTIVVEVLADTEQEDEEQFILTLSDASGATISGGDAIGTIKDYKVIIDEPGDGYTTPLEYDGYTLLWNDEFTDEEIDLSRYTHELGDHGWGNEELQNYTASPDNSFIDGGKLVIEAREESAGNYSSARIITKDKFEFTFGRVDIRAKVPTAQGIWPALWMLGANFGDIGWPACGEIDIMELVGFEPNTVHGTAHYGSQGLSYSINDGDKKVLQGNAKYSDEFHVFSIEWQADRIDWFMDDQRYFTLTKNAVGNEVWRFNQEFFFILNVAVGGNWPGNPDATTTFPQEMVIDYIRVFQ